MTDEEVYVGNILIAQFMGIKIRILSYSGRGVGLFNDDQYHPKLAYHKEWNWLMPVVEKIETITAEDFDKKYIQLPVFCFNIENNISTINMHVQFEMASEIDLPNMYVCGTDKLDAVYKTVVGFIKWYNKEKLCI